MNKDTFFLLIVLFAGCLLGYHYKDYQVTQKELTKSELVAVAKDAYQQGLSDLSSNYKNDLKDVLSKNKVIKETITNEKTKPVFINVCVSDEYISLFNKQTEQYLEKLPSQ